MVIIIITVVFSCIPSTIKMYDIADLSSTTKTLKTANFWTLTTPIYINDADPNSNWSKTASDNDWCSGSGTYSDPYIIENVIIQGMNLVAGIVIKSSSVNFVIKNCTIANIQSYRFEYGIELDNVTNGKLIDNNFSYNRLIGIYLYYSDNNTLLGNLGNDNFESGIRLQYSSNNTITGNTASENKEVGIYLTSFSNNNTISQNTVNSNTNNGIILSLECSNNTITENIINYSRIGILLERSSNGNKIIGNYLIGNQICIKESESSHNTFENNDCREHESSAILGFDLTILISLVGVISPILAIIIKKRIKNTYG
ncbi:MAG: NosD domain-containing protein [Promethearchaeota archaeon]